MKFEMQILRFYLVGQNYICETNAKRNGYIKVYVPENPLIKYER